MPRDRGDTARDETAAAPALNDSLRTAMPIDQTGPDQGSFRSRHSVGTRVWRLSSTVVRQRLDYETI